MAASAASVVAMALLWAWPLTAAIQDSDGRTIRVSLSLLTITLVMAAAFAPRTSGRVRMLLAGALAMIAAGLLAVHAVATGTCVADYDGRPLVIGRTVLPATDEYLRRNPGSSSSDLLLAAGGESERVWTSNSIAACRLGLGWGGLAAVPLAASAITLLLAHRRQRFAEQPVIATPAIQPTAPPRYDAFLSYRHTAPDSDHATALVEFLEAEGFRAAIDARDFRPNEHFLTEMERCVKQSRFTLCVITARYLESDHCVEEALITKTLDMAERRKRVVPLIFERVELPVWLHGLVGIDFTASAAVDPERRLHSLLQEAKRSEQAAAQPQ